MYVKDEKTGQKIYLPKITTSKQANRISEIRNKLGAAIRTRFSAVGVEPNDADVQRITDTILNSGYNFGSDLNADIQNLDETLFQHVGVVARRIQGQRTAEELGRFENEFTTSAAKHKADMARFFAERNAATLGQLEQEQARELEIAQPETLEFLNTRGFATSPSTTAEAFAQIQKDLQLEKQREKLGLEQQTQENLYNFENDVFSEKQNLRGKALEALVGGRSAGLDFGTELSLGGLEEKYRSRELDRKLSFAGTEARRNRRNQLLASLIGAGGQAGAAILA